MIGELAHLLDPFRLAAAAGVPGPSHIAAHVVITLAYLAALARVPGAFRRLMYLRPATLGSGAAFFGLCAMTHLANALAVPYADVVHASDAAQAVAIVAFLMLLAGDLASAVRRLAGAFRAIARRHGPDVAADVAATITAALQNRPPSRRG